MTLPTLPSIPFLPTLMDLHDAAMIASETVAKAHCFVFGHRHFRLYDPASGEPYKYCRNCLQTVTIGEGAA